MSEGHAEAIIEDLRAQLDEALRRFERRAQRSRLLRAEVRKLKNELAQARAQLQAISPGCSGHPSIPGHPRGTTIEYAS